MPYVNQRWLGGMLTNFVTIKKRIGLLDQLEARQQPGDFERLPKKEAAKLTEELARLQRTLGGMRKMQRLPGAIFVIDPHRERIAVTEAHKLEIPVIGTGDTNVDPDELDYIIPANDDAIRAIRLLCRLVADAAIEGAAERASRAVEPEPEPMPRSRRTRGGDRRAGRGPRRRRRVQLRARRRGRPPARRSAARACSADRRGASPEEIAAELAREAAETAEACRRRRPRRRRPGLSRRVTRSRPHHPPRRARCPPRTHRSTNTDMANITAEMVRDLRERTSAGMMDCKRALEETDGDLEKAVAPPARARPGGRRQEGRPGGPRGPRSSSYIHTGGRRRACSSRSTARPTSSPAPTSSSGSSATSPCRSPGSHRCSSTIEAIPADVA